MKTTIVTGVFAARDVGQLVLPYFSARISAGAPTRADEPMRSSLNILNYLIKHADATFFVTVEGDSMEPDIQEGDLLVVDRVASPNEDSSVIIHIDGEFTVKRYSECDGKLRLVPINPNHKPRIVGDGQSCEIWGTVTHVIHKF